MATTTTRSPKNPNPHRAKNSVGGHVQENRTKLSVAAPIDLVERAPRARRAPTSRYLCPLDAARIAQHRAALLAAVEAERLAGRLPESIVLELEHDGQVRAAPREEVLAWDRTEPDFHEPTPGCVPVLVCYPLGGESPHSFGSLSYAFTLGVP